MPTTEKRSFCRICNAACGVKITVDDSGRMIDVRGDKDDLMTHGYACVKGLHSGAMHYAPDRILTPLKRRPEGGFAPIALETALDEIAEKLRTILAEDGPEAIGGFRGGGAYMNTAVTNILRDWLDALGSHKFFTTRTIDQSAKLVAAGRIGTWQGGRQLPEHSDVILLFGTNPLVSVCMASFDMRNPTKRMKEVRGRGVKLIVIDPRRTETAVHADIFLQCLPGEDPTIAASLLRIILSEGWEDKAFCDLYVGDLAELRRAIEPFTPEYAARRAGVSAEALRQAAAMFARDGKSGYAASGTGPNMAPRSNLAEHLIECLNVVCGRYLRAGDKVPNPGVLTPRRAKKAQVQSAQRWWEQGFKSRIGGYGMLLGDMMTGILADEILEPGAGRIRAFFNHGSNLVNILPDQKKSLRALESLDLLVSVEPFMNETAKISDYIFPPPLMYERPDLTGSYVETAMYFEPFARYTPAAVAPPPGSALVEEWQVFWGLAQRLGLQLVYDGVPLDMASDPTIDDLQRIIARHCPEPWDEFKRHELGKVFDADPQYVEPADAAATGHFSTMPADVAAELAEVAAEPFAEGGIVSNGQRFSYRLSSRRIREVFNSTGRNIGAVRERMPFNFAYLNPGELDRLGVAAGDKIWIESDSGRIPAVVAPDPALRPGVVSMAHGWGGLPDETIYERDGSNTGLLISTDKDVETINAMPRLSAIPVNITRF